MSQVRVPQTVDSGDVAEPKMQVLLRAYHVKHKNHFYTTDYREMEYKIHFDDYHAESAPGFVYTEEAVGTIPLYRLYHPGRWDHFYTTSVTEKEDAIVNLGYMPQGVAGWVYAKSDGAVGAVPLFRMFKKDAVDHLYTTSMEERNAQEGDGYIYERVQCYIRLHAV